MAFSGRCRCRGARTGPTENGSLEQAKVGFAKAKVGSWVCTEPTGNGKMTDVSAWWSPGFGPIAGC